jgi:hypothetical protein
MAYLALIILVIALSFGALAVARLLTNWFLDR